MEYLTGTGTLFRILGNPRDLDTIHGVYTTLKAPMPSLTGHREHEDTSSPPSSPAPSQAVSRRKPTTDILATCTSGSQHNASPTTLSRSGLTK